MGRIVFSIISLIVLAVIIVMNAGTSGAFNLFGYQFEEVPIIVIAIVSFVLGAIYSFIFYISSFLARTRREKLAMQKQRLKSQEQTIKSKDASLKEREKQADTVSSAPGQRALPAGAAQAGGAPFARSGARPVGSGTTAATGERSPATKRSGGWLRNLFGRNTDSSR